MKKVLVTGAGGFIGSNLVDKLVEQEYDVTVIDDFSTGNKAYLNENATVIESCLLKRSQNELVEDLKGMEVLFHVAALPRVEPSIHDPISTNLINVDASLKIFHAAVKAGVKKIVFSSSSSVYGDAKQIPTSEECPTHPMSPYALQKLHCEQYLKLFHELYGVESVSLRYFNVYGRRQPKVGSYVPVVGIFFRQRKEGQALTVTGDGQQTRDFVNVDDVVQANILSCAEHVDGCRVYNVGSGKNHTVLDIAKMVDDNIKHIDPRIEPKLTLADITNIKKDLGYEPTVVLEDWIKENLDKE